MWYPLILDKQKCKKYEGGVIFCKKKNSNSNFSTQFLKATVYIRYFIETSDLAKSISLMAGPGYIIAKEGVIETIVEDLRLLFPYLLENKS